MDESNVVKGLADKHLNGNGHHDVLEDIKQMAAAAGSKDLTVSNVLGNLMMKADDKTKTKLQALLDKARQLGVHDDKVS
jgi:hypothetical protein